MTPEEAELYAAVHDGSAGDVAFYVRLAEEGRSVLELGCGTGRVARALGEAGFEVVGVERDPGMLEVARAAPHANVRFVEGDMASFELGARFDRVVIPFTGLYCLESAEALDAMLAAVRAHLAPDGLFAFDVYVADAFHAECAPDDVADDALEPVATITHRGERLEVSERSAWDPSAQRIDATYVYRRADGSTRAELTIAHRYVLLPQLLDALERAGLSLLGMYGGFDGAPFGPDSEQLVLVAELAEERARP